MNKLVLRLDTSKIDTTQNSENLKTTIAISVHISLNNLLGKISSILIMLIILIILINNFPSIR